MNCECVLHGTQLFKSRKNLFIKITPSPYILYGPHGYNTFTHSRCQEVILPKSSKSVLMLMLILMLQVPTVDVQMSAIKGDW